jgi:hypothetical protein
MLWSVRLSKRFRDGLLAILGVAALSLAAFFALHEPLGRPVRLRMTAGQEGGTRHRIAQALQREAAQRAIAIELQAMAGSEAAIQAVESGLVDAAFVQGGLDMIDHPGIRQVAVLHVEPLHLLVKELMSGFLAHASDARDFLMRLICTSATIWRTKRGRSTGRPRCYGTRRSANGPTWHWRPESSMAETSSQAKIGRLPDRGIF